MRDHQRIDPAPTVVLGIGPQRLVMHGIGRAERHLGIVRPAEDHVAVQVRAIAAIGGGIFEGDEGGEAARLVVPFGRGDLVLPVGIDALRIVQPFAFLAIEPGHHPAEQLEHHRPAFMAEQPPPLGGIAGQVALARHRLADIPQIFGMVGDGEEIERCMAPDHLAQVIDRLALGIAVSIVGRGVGFRRRSVQRVGRMEVEVAEIDLPRTGIADDGQGGSRGCLTCRLCPRRVGCRFGATARERRSDKQRCQADNS